MSRPEKPIDPSAGPIQAFAVELRAARSRAGLTYKQMAERGFVSQSTLSKTASGEGPPPTWDAVEAYLRSLGLGSELPFWRGRWTTLPRGHAKHTEQPTQRPAPAEAPAQPQPHEPSPVPEPTPTQAPAPRWRPHPVGIGVAAGLLLLTTFAIATIPLMRAGTPPRGRQPHASQGAFTLRDRGQAATIMLVTIQNLTAAGPAGPVEEDTPVYLSSRPIPDCARHGCKVDGTDMWSGATLAVTCTVTGTLVSSSDGVASPLWYRGVMAGHRSGYLPEARVAAPYRGGLGLPPCDQRPQMPL